MKDEEGGRFDRVCRSLRRAPRRVARRDQLATCQDDEPRGEGLVLSARQYGVAGYLAPLVRFLPIVTAWFVSEFESFFARILIIPTVLHL